ncbi:aminoglycoside phosphotransferase family protein [Aliiroseovarius sp. KMU-50]|uniref:Aminoglycoside phosphotransferase family protein n=1 Tax=Aliiroseovarius salicola TaxID=3009082 RepID=A0ABT4VZB0_9RHOB|nr:aminoglycoside phosphotransferase family protein [Aliiroseovarius sp. KMU-50]MDA5093593.1 aminoglycoside phosphotransferase family protein [Aliiroseovarius sp. KMU-50]
MQTVKRAVGKVGGSVVNDVVNSEEDLLRSALAHWPDLARHNGWPTEVPHQILASRSDAHAERIVLCLTLPDRKVVLKHEMRGKSVDAFAAEVDAQKFAFSVLGETSVPDILAADPEQRLAVMNYVPGRPAHELLELAEIGLEDSASIVERCGVWLGKFHAQTLKETRAINPDAMLNWGAQMQELVTARDPDVPRRDLFFSCSDQLPGMGEAVRGQTTRVCASHGDMHLRNLLLSDTQCWAIDFAPLSFVPPAHDLARLLVRYANHFDALPGKDPLEAFWRGYGEEHREDPALAYILPIILLDDWKAIPKRREDRSPRQQRRLKGTLRLAQDLFDL